MTKQNKLWLMLDLIFLVVFNLIFYVTQGTDNPSGVWLAYGFIHFAYLMLLVTPKLGRRSSSQAVFSMVCYTISSTYFLLELIWGAVLIFIYPDKFLLSFISQLILAGIYGALLLSHMLANERTAEALVVHEHELQFVKQSASRLQGVLDQVQDKALQVKLEQAYDLAHASQVKSNQPAQKVEQSVLSLIDALENAAASRDQQEMNLLLDQIIAGIKKRNRQLQFEQ